MDAHQDRKARARSVPRAPAFAAIRASSDTGGDNDKICRNHRAVGEKDSANTFIPRDFCRPAATRKMPERAGSFPNRGMASYLCMIGMAHLDADLAENDAVNAAHHGATESRALNAGDGREGPLA
jgi:hypothetical protein